MASDLEYLDGDVASVGGSFLSGQVMAGLWGLESAANIEAAAKKKKPAKKTPAKKSPAKKAPAKKKPRAKPTKGPGCVTAPGSTCVCITGTMSPKR